VIRPRFRAKDSVRLNAELTIALDAMGGDHAPQVVVKGAAIARTRHPKVKYLFVGDEKRIKPLLAKRKALAKVSEIQHTEIAIGPDDKPSAALRGGRQSSMRLALDAVADGKAHAMVSAGNTGALMALAKFALRTLPGIDRPAIASFFPTLRGESVMLDLGANLECDADNLVQFAIMGSIFAQNVFGVLEPTIGLLNVGSEEMKGHDELKQASAKLREMQLPGIYHGFIEGNDIPSGTTEVVVADGFSGNIALKTAEGMSKLYSEFLKRTFRSSIAARLGYLLSAAAFRKLRVRLDPRRYNGAMFLGLGGVCVKSHGGTDAFGYANAIGVAVDLVIQGFNDKLREELARLAAQQDAALPPSAAAAI
jgi:glycerol-3-phosphate acyltransferase PlsX